MRVTRIRLSLVLNILSATNKHLLQKKESVVAAGTWSIRFIGRSLYSSHYLDKETLPPPPDPALFERNLEIQFKPVGGANTDGIANPARAQTDKQTSAQARRYSAPRPQRIAALAPIQLGNTPTPHSPTGQIVNPTTGHNFPNSADYYPAASMRLGEEGSAIVHVCVAPTGRLSEDPTIAKTSGSARLDEGAIKLASAGRFVAGTDSGKPTAGCFNMSIKFQLSN
jgi:TonB family protein